MKLVLLEVVNTNNNLHIIAEDSMTGELLVFTLKKNKGWTRFFRPIQQIQNPDMLIKRLKDLTITNQKITYIKKGKRIILL